MVKIGLKTGCYCLLVNLQSMKFCFGVYGDFEGGHAEDG